MSLGTPVALAIFDVSSSRVHDRLISLPLWCCVIVRDCVQLRDAHRLGSRTGTDIWAHFTWSLP